MMIIDGISFFSPFRRPPVNPFGSMMGFGMGPNLFSGGMPFYNPFPRMPMYGGGLGGFGGFGGMGGGFNPFIMTPPPMQRFPRYDSLIPMQSQMPSQSLQDLPYQPKQPEMTSIEQRPPMDSRPINLADVQGPIDMVDPRPIPGVDSTVGQPRTDIEQLPTPMPDTGADFKPFDPSGLQSRLDALENRPTPSFTPFDPSGLQARIGDLEGRQMFDPSGLKSRIDALENRQMPTFTPFDPSGLQSRLNTLEDRIQKTGNINMADIEALIEQRLSDSLRNMNLSPRNPGVNSITYDPNVSIPFKEEDLRKRYNDRLFIGQGGPYDI